MHTVRTRLCNRVMLVGLLSLVLIASCAGGGVISLTGVATAVGAGDKLSDSERSSATSTPAVDLDLPGAGDRLDVAELNGIEAARSNITAGPSSSLRQLTVRFMGTCADAGGLWVYGRGFAPGGEFLIGADYPDDSPQRGAPYSRLPRGGLANEDGSITAVRLECVDPDTKLHDPLGIYTVVFHELTTGERIRAEFVMK